MTEKVFLASERLEEFVWNFQKSVTFDNIESHKKGEFYPLFRRKFFGKTTDEAKSTPLATFLGLRNLVNSLFSIHLQLVSHKPATPVKMTFSKLLEGLLFGIYQCTWQIFWNVEISTFTLHDSDSTTDTPPVIKFSKHLQKTFAVESVFCGYL